MRSRRVDKLVNTSTRQLNTYTTSQVSFVSSSSMKL